MISQLNNREGNLDKKIYDCKICKNKGQIYYLKEENKGTFYEDEEYVKDCECLKKRRTIENMRNNGLLKVFDTKTLDLFKTPSNWHKNVKNKAIEYIKTGKNEWFLFSGTVGCGKTHLATAISIELFNKGLSFHYMQFSGDIVRLTHNMNNYNEKIKTEADEEFNKLLNVDLLYIDDFLKISEYDKTVTKQTVFTLINNRYINNKKTIITTEFGMADLLQYDSAVGSRIIEKAKGYILDFTNISVEEKNNLNWRLR